MINNINILLDKNSSMATVISAIKALETEKLNSNTSPQCSFGISANITINDLEIELKRQSFIFSNQPKIIIGNYRDHIGNAESFFKANIQYAIFIWFFDALVPGLSLRVQNLSEKEKEEICNSFTIELRTVLGNVNKYDKIFIPKFHKIRFNSSMQYENEETKFIEKLNYILETETSNIKSIVLLDVLNIIVKHGVDFCIDERMYFLYKQPYTSRFLYEFASDIFKEIRGNNSYYKKVLVLDCDNTLWRGIIGDDGLSGIKLSPDDFPGNIFWQAQHFFISLKNRGVLLALCSKNDMASVQEVLTEHAFCPLKDEYFVIKKVNWDSKVDNIKNIASELNLGLDSFVFLDDSDYECEAIRSTLPQVTVFQVPKKISEYPALLKQISDFFPIESDKVSIDKTEEYRIRAQVKLEQSKWDSKDDYLRSLKTVVNIKKNDKEKIQRIAELAQKTNQFNLTTKRYSENNINEFMDSKLSDVYSIYVKDKFGDSGLVGFCIISYDQNDSYVDSYVLSCRVLGRGVEYAIWPSICGEILNHGVKQIKATYIPTSKNSMVSNFLDALNFELSYINEKKKYYTRLLHNIVDLENLINKHFLEVKYHD